MLELTELNINNKTEYYDCLKQLPPELQQIVLTHRVMCGLASQKDWQWLERVGGFRADLLEPDEEDPPSTSD